MGVLNCSLVHNKRQTSCAGHTLLREGGPKEKGRGGHAILTWVGLGEL